MTLKKHKSAHIHTHTHILPQHMDSGLVLVFVCIWGLLFVLAHFWHVFFLCVCLRVSPFVCVCVSGQRHRRRGRGGGSRPCSVQGKQPGFTAISTWRRHENTVCFQTNAPFTHRQLPPHPSKYALLTHWHTRAVFPQSPHITAAFTESAPILWLTSPACTDSFFLSHDHTAFHGSSEATQRKRRLRLRRCLSVNTQVSHPWLYLSPQIG